MTKTENYRLNQWDPEDRVIHTDFNDDNAKLDAALKAQADAVAAETQARKDAVAAEAQARQAADTAESQARQALAGQFSQYGNCKIVYGRYTGSGKYGSANPTSLTFPRKPLLIFISPVSWGGGLIRLALFQGCTYAFGDMSSSGSTCTVTWSGNSVSWYTNGLGSQCSAAGEYMYVAFLAMDE